jgi:Zn-dependent protease
MDPNTVAWISTATKWVIGIVVFVMTITFHEVAHGAVAFVRGDNTAKVMGRLTLNPLKHIDWFWTIVFRVMLYVSIGMPIGMAKPVPVNFQNLHHQRRDTILVAIAGPLANVIFACFLGVMFRATGFELLVLFAYLNLGLAVFNLIPIPPLDGSRVLAGVLPRPLDRQYLSIEPFGFIIVLGLYFTGVLFAWVVPGMNLLASWLRLPKLGF